MTPRFIKEARISSKARKAMEAGTKFANKAIDPNLTAKDLLGCLKLAIERKDSSWFVLRMHGIYNRRRLYEERALLGLN